MLVIFKVVVILSPGPRTQEALLSMQLSCRTPTLLSLGKLHCEAFVHIASSSVLTYISRTVPTMTSEEKKERPISMINEASNYNMTSDYAVHPLSPVGRVSYFAFTVNY